MKLTVRRATILSGALWLAIGINLLLKGTHYLSKAASAVISGTHLEFSLIKKLTEYTKNPQQSVLILICFALIVGFFKGRVVFKRTVKRVVARIRDHAPTISLFRIYSKKFLLLILGMMGLGMTLKYLPLPDDVKGLIDFAVGVALINGATLYFREAFLEQKKSEL